MKRWLTYLIKGGEKRQWTETSDTIKRLIGSSRISNSLNRYQHHKTAKSSLVYFKNKLIKPPKVAVHILKQ